MREGSRVVDDGIWVQEVGEGPLVVLVHGAMDRSGGMLRVRRVLQPAYRVVRYDRRGYARSLAAGPPESFAQQVDDLEDILDGRPAVLAGHSFGGLICLALAERRPDVARAVLAYEAPMTWEPWWPTGSGRRVPAALGTRNGDVDPTHTDPYDAAEWFLRRMIGDQMWERLPRGMRAERRAEGPTLVAEMHSVRPPAPVPVDPSAIMVPVVAAHGSEARPHHKRATGEVARGAPLGELAVIEGAGHGAHLTHPEAFAGLVRRAAERTGETN